MKQVDVILNCRWVIPVEPHNVIYDNYAIVIQDGKIADLLPIETAKSKYSSKENHLLTDHAVMPGFVNTHTHSPMALFRGLADDLPLMEWLNDYIWPTEKKWLNAEFIEDGTDLALAEMIKGGTTCFNEHFFFPEQIAKSVIQAKMRACIGPTIINFPTNWSNNELDGFNKFVDLHQNFQNNEALITWSLAPHSPYGTTDQVLQKIANYAAEHQLPIHMHVHETAHEVQESLEKFAMRPIRRLYELDLLSPRFSAVHLTQINDEDIHLLMLTKANVTHCPESNLKLASGYSPVDRLLQHDINVSLGTDGAASNNDLDMIGEMRTAALIGKTVSNSATALNAPTVLRMATLNGAKALGLSDQIGSIEVGKSADIVAIDLNQLNTQPTYHPVSQIVYSAMASQVSDVWVAGVQLLKTRQLMTLDEERILTQAKKWRSRIQGNSNGY